MLRKDLNLKFYEIKMRQKETMWRASSAAAEDEH